MTEKTLYLLLMGLSLMVGLIVIFPDWPWWRRLILFVALVLTIGATVGAAKRGAWM